MDLRHLFRRGPGRRRLPSAYQAERARADGLAQQLNALASRAALVEVRCYASDADHPVWWTDEAPGDCPWCVAQQFAIEAGGLRRILNALEIPVDGSGSVPQPALADVPGSWTSRPVPPPVPDLRIVDVAPGPVGCEAADVNARTQQTDVRSLRPAVLPVGPVYAPWGIRPDGVRPPLPDEAPTVRQSAVTAVLPVWDATITLPVELSKTTGDRARSKVRAAVGAVP